MIQNQLKLLPTSSISIPREARQRTDLSEPSVYTLAISIAKDGLLQNIGVTAEDSTIIFGERRYTAITMLARAFENQCSAELSSEQRAALVEAARAEPLYDNWTKIPCRIVKGSSPFSHFVLEFVENFHREDLPWLDRARAALAIHRQAKKESPGTWTERQTATLLSIEPSVLNRLMAPLIETETASEKTQEKVREAVEASTTPVSALNAARTIKERFGEATQGKDQKASQLSKLFDTVTPPVVEDEPKAEEIEEPSILHADFTTWVQTYTGPKFNFVHCDFPYGIEFNKSAGQSTSAATKQVGQYSDGEDVYWNLLETLLTNRDKLFASEAHLMFWYSQKFDRETQDVIIKAWPDAVISHFRLIWYCSDDSGLCPAPDYEGRRNYETAFQITLGKRKLAKPKSLCFAAPRNEKKIHRSQKHLPVLRHFFSQYVDESTIMLDPTCGSATSVITAKKLGARYVLGLERDEEMVKLARKYMEDKSSS